jgi:site-specific DNA recombinase
VGEIKHKGVIHKGQHEGIIDRKVWDKVQKLLNQNRQGSGSGQTRTRSESLLTGRLFDQSGICYIPTHAQKGGRRYRYYTSQAVIKRENKEGPIGRLPAPALEDAVVERIRKLLGNPAELIDVIKQLNVPFLDYDDVLNHARRISSEWEQRALREKADLIGSVIYRVVILEGSLELQLHLESMMGMLLGKPVPDRVGTSKPQTASLTIPFRHISQGKAFKIVIGRPTENSSPSRAAVERAIARARSWYDLIVQGNANCLPDVARKQGLMACYVQSIFPLAFLSPDSVEFLLNGREGQARTLASVLQKVPLHWEQQREFIRGVQDSNG